jgi:hypothetical protein
MKLTIEQLKANVIDRVSKLREIPEVAGVAKDYEKATNWWQLVRAAAKHLGCSADQAMVEYVLECALDDKAKEPNEEDKKFAEQYGEIK